VECEACAEHGSAGRAPVRGLPPGDPGVEDAAAVWVATIKERDRGLVFGPFPASEMDARFGPGQWRAIRRFGVWQKGKCRACDNCAESGHNEATVMKESLICDTPGFPARAAALLVAVLGADVATGGLLFGGMEDIEAAYRRILAANPGATMFCLADPEQGSPYSSGSRASTLGWRARRSRSRVFRG
jgi:hypothetical protein